MLKDLKPMQPIKNFNEITNVISKYNVRLFYDFDLKL